MAEEALAEGLGTPYEASRNRIVTRWIQHPLH